ncbi:MAG: hypothetical protein ACSHW9_06230, partial [Salinibacterium amurskyense]
MAFHDDVDDANDANDETSSKHEFELPFPHAAAAKKPGSDSAGSLSDDGRIDLSEASADGIIDLDAAFNSEAPEPVSARDDSLAPSEDSAIPAPFDLNEEFQRSDIADALNQGMPPWAMAPAPDPTQAVPQLDAPESASISDAPVSAEEPTPAVSDPATASADDDDDDPYQIPADYTTPDFFASRISRRRTPAEAEAENAAAAAAELAALEEEANATVSGADGVVATGDAFDVSADSADEKEFSFESLFATEEPAAAPKPPASADDFDDTMWADVSPAIAEGEPAAEAAESDAPANHIWKLGPLEPEVAGTPVPASSSVPTDGTELPTDTAAALPIEEVVEGAPMWNLDGKDAPATAAEVPSLGLDGFLSLDNDQPVDDAAAGDEQSATDAIDATDVADAAHTSSDAAAEAENVAAELPPVESVSAFDLDAAFKEAAAAVPTGVSSADVEGNVADAIDPANDDATLG